jgi:hypothetical protein
LLLWNTPPIQVIDVVYCLNQGYAGTPENVRSEIEEFLAEHTGGTAAAE